MLNIEQLFSLGSKNIFFNPLLPFSANCEQKVTTKCGITTKSNSKRSSSEGKIFESKLSPISSRRIKAASTDGIEYGSIPYYLVCALGGSISCSITHIVTLPIDLIKCRIQVDSVKYPGIWSGLKTTIAEEGISTLGKGWSPTTIGYGLQGILRFGLYEVLKKEYREIVGPEIFYNYTSLVFLAAAASAEFIADFPLAPFEGLKVRMQTIPGFPLSLGPAIALVLKKEGMFGLYKTLPPLWGRQIPYTMVKFTTFEKVLGLIYTHIVKKPREQNSKPQQLLASFSAGYIAGVLCAIVSHPSDTLISKVQKVGETWGSVYKKIGFMGLWKGVGARILMIGAIAGGQWFTYDAVKHAFNLPPIPPPEKPRI